MNIMVEQYVDYCLFQGFDHIFYYSHTFSQNNDTVGYFYKLFRENGYISNNLVTLIEWPTAVHKKNIHHHTN